LANLAVFGFLILPAAFCLSKDRSLRFGVCEQVDQKKLREQRRKANGNKDPEPEEEGEGGLDAMGRLNAADAAKYADYKAAMDPEKRKEFEAKLADARAGITRES